MTKSKAIKLKCLDCSSDSPKEVTLCHIFDCPLWPHRLGVGIETKVYKARIEKTLKRSEKEISELHKMGIDTGFFLKHSAKSHHSQNSSEQAEAMT